MIRERDADGWHFIDEHCIRFEPPDLVLMRLIGDVSLEQNIQTMKWLDQRELPATGFYVLVDLAQMGRQDPRLMKAADLVHTRHLCRGMIYYNALFHQRTVVGIFLRVARAFNHPLTKTPTEIFTTEKEARDWIAKDQKRKG